jgi:hypothetical protein
MMPSVSRRLSGVKLDLRAGVRVLPTMPRRSPSGCFRGTVWQKCRVASSFEIAPEPVKRTGLPQQPATNVAQTVDRFRRQGQ